MAKHRVPLFKQPNRSVEVDPAATEGAVVGRNLFLADGTVVTVDMILNVEDDGDGLDAVYWRTIQERPPNVDALAAQEGTGLYVITGPGASETREISSSTLSVQNGDGVASDPAIDLDELEDSGSGALMAIERDQYGRVAGTKPATITGVEGEVTVEHGDAVGGLPTVGLADVPDEGGGALQRFQRDGKGRVAGTSSATTDDLPEGDRLYFTDERARAAAVTDNIDPLATGTAPSGRAVSEALDGKADKGSVVNTTDNQTNIQGDKEWQGAHTFYGAGPRFLGAGTGVTGAQPSFQLRTEAENRRFRIRYDASEAADGPFLVQKYISGSWTTVLETDVSASELYIRGKRFWHDDNLNSGTITPDCTAVSNAASCSANSCSFARVGNSVVYSGSVSVTPSAANAASIVSIAIPVASNFSSGTDASGPVTGKAAGIPSFEIGQIFAEAGASRLNLHFYPSTTNDYTMRFSVVYPIL